MLSSYQCQKSVSLDKARHSQDSSSILKATNSSMTFSCRCSLWNGFAQAAHSLSLELTTKYPGVRFLCHDRFDF